MAPETLSGVPQVITLSGLQSGGTYSGQPQQSLAGGPQQGQATPGLTGGLDLAQLMQLLQQGGDTGGLSSLLGLGAPISAGSFGQLGQQPGGFGGLGGLGGPTGGQSTLAGASSGQTSAGSGSIDPAAVLQKLLGVGKSALGALGGPGTASPTLGDTGTSLSDQVRSGGNVGPVGASLPGDPNALGGLPGVTDPNAPGGLPPQTASPVTQQYVNAPGQAVGLSPSQQGMIQTLLDQGATSDQIYQIIQSGGLGTGLGEIPGASANLAGPGAAVGTGFSQAGSSLSGAGPQGGVPSPTQPGGGLGALGTTQQGLGGLLGVLNLIQGLRGGNALGAAGGGLQALGAGANLAGAGTLGAGAGGLGGLLGLAAGIQGLLKGGNVGGSLANLGGGALGTYGALSSLAPGTFTPLSTLAGEALAAIAPETAASLGIGAGAAGAGAGAAAGGAAAGSAAAGGAAAGGAAAGGAAGLGGVIALPLIAGAILNAFHQGGNIMDIFGGTEENPDPYQTFTSRLQGEEAQQGKGLTYLQQALPYAQSQQDLSSLLNHYRQYVQGGNQALAPFLGSGFQLGAIPGMGSQTHGQQTTPVDWTGAVNTDQSYINALQQMLPATGGGTMTDTWNQIVNNAAAQSQITNSYRGDLVNNLDPYARAQYLSGFTQPTPITAPMNPLFQAMGYQGPQYTQLPQIDPAALAQVQAVQAAQAPPSQVLQPVDPFFANFSGA